MRGLITQRYARSGERGATLALVALMMMVLFGAAALSIDLGSGWRTRRALIPGTDATALASVQGYVETGTQPADCTAWDGVDYLTENLANATLVGSCVWGGNADQGFVVVTAEAPAETWFTGLLGWGDVEVQSTSAAAYGPPSAARGLRPIGLCIDGSSVLENIIRNPPATETLVRIDYDKDQPGDCGGSSIPGNWGTIDFDGGANSNSDTKDWITNGYPGTVTFEDHTVTSCSGEPHCYEGDTGALAGINSELNGLRSSGIYFELPVFNFVENPGGNALFHLMGLVRVRLVDYRVTGPEANRFFEFLVMPGLVPGICCDGDGGAGGNLAVAMCATDPSDLSACTP